MAQDGVAVKLLETLAANMEAKEKEWGEKADGPRLDGTPGCVAQDSEFHFFSGVSLAYGGAHRAVNDTIEAYRIARSE